MADLKLNDGGDLDITRATPSLVRGADAIGQHVRIRLRMVKGEAFQAPDEGMPYFDTIFEKGTRGAAIAAIFRRAILDTPGVLEILDFDATQDPSTRRFLMSFQVRVDGQDTPLTFSEFVI